MGRDVVLWLFSPDFDLVPEGAIIPEFRLQFELHRDETTVMAMADALRPFAARVFDDGVSTYDIEPPEPLIAAKRALDAYEATFIKVTL
jgi:hypothetical protein